MAQAIGGRHYPRIGREGRQTTIKMRKDAQDIMTKRRTMRLDNLGRCKRKDSRIIGNRSKMPMQLNVNITVHILKKKARN